MSADTSSQKPKSKIAFATIRMPDGKEHEIPLAPKTFSSGREGYYSQVPSFVYDNEVYGGQIQIWKKSEKGQQKAWSYDSKVYYDMFARRDLTTEGFVII